MARPARLQATRQQALFRRRESPRSFSEGPLLIADVPQGEISLTV